MARPGDNSWSHSECKQSPPSHQPFPVQHPAETAALQDGLHNTNCFQENKDLEWVMQIGEESNQTNFPPSAFCKSLILMMQISWIWWSRWPGGRDWSLMWPESSPESSHGPGHPTSASIIRDLIKIPGYWPPDHVLGNQPIRGMYQWRCYDKMEYLSPMGRDTRGESHDRHIRTTLARPWQGEDPG